jgi:prefoldin subunit 5
MSEADVTASYYKNSLLLETDIIEEIQTLTEEIERKEKTIEDVLNLPNKLSYDCLVPLSKVAFSPGRLIHTNEFSVQVGGESGVRQWMSHVDAADFLRGEITRLRGDITELQNYSIERHRQGQGQGQVQDAEIKTGERINLSETVAKPRSPLDSSATTVAGKEKKKEEVGEYSPFAEELGCGSSGCDNESDEEDEEDDEEGWRTSTEGVSGEGFEIREYCDQDGNVLDGQVVDLSAELTQLQTEQQQGKTKQQPSAGEGGASGGGDSDSDNLFKDINDKLNVPSSSSGPAELDVSTALHFTDIFFIF